MSACERCWGVACARAHLIGGDVAEHYRDLLDERHDTPCSLAEQGKGRDG